MTTIPYGRQEISEADIQAVVDILRSDFLTQGPVVPAFEAAVARYCGAQHAVAANSATSALHLACLALDVGPGDRVWTTAVTFVASANCALYCGAQIDFVDIDPGTYNLSVDDLTRKLVIAEAAGILPKVVIAVHLCGQSCDMAAIHALGSKYGFRIVEDASHAIGGHYRGESIGNCRYSDIAVFSFHPVKIITTAEGGMAVTNQGRLAKRMQLLRTHGVTRDVDDMAHAPEGPWYYEQIELGFNYRMNEMQGALGLSQLTRLDEFVAKRNRIAARYDELLEGLPIAVPRQLPDCQSAHHLYVVRVDKEKHRRVFVQLRAAGVGVNLHYIPVYRHPYYAVKGFHHEDFPAAERYYSEALTLPIYPRLEPEQQNLVVEALKAALA